MVYMCNLTRSDVHECLWHEMNEYVSINKKRRILERVTIWYIWVTRLVHECLWHEMNEYVSSNKRGGFSLKNEQVGNFKSIKIAQTKDSTFQYYQNLSSKAQILSHHFIKWNLLLRHYFVPKGMGEYQIKGWELA